jgi:hypothetical protein
MDEADPKAKLEPFQALIGEWTIEMTHPMVEDTVVRGRVTYEWLEGGRFLIQRAVNDHPDFRLGRRPPRRRADLHPHSPRPRRYEAVAAGHLRERRHECDDSSQGGCGRQERAGPRRRNRGISW